MMSILRLPRRRFLLVTVCFCCLFGPTLAASAGKPKSKDARRADIPLPGVPGANGPQEMFEQFFGGFGEIDDKQLAEITISAAAERRIGKEMVQAYLNQLDGQGIRVVARGNNVRYVQALIDTIRPLMHNADRYRAIKVYVAESDLTDARSFPGGTVVIHRGMIQYAENEAALVGILSHELSHIDRRHQLLPYRRLKYAQQSFAGQGRAPDIGRLMSSSRLMATMWLVPFRPQDEAEADLDGGTWTYQAGYDPGEMGRLFLRLHERDKDNPGEKIPLFRTHPFRLERHRAIVNLCEDLQARNPKQELYVGRENLRRRVPKSEMQFRE